MVEENISQELWLKNINFLEEIQQNEMISRKHNKFCITLKHIEHFLILASAITGCISISAFHPFLVISIAFTGYPTALKICAIASRIKQYKSIVKKKKNTRNKKVLLAKFKLNRIEFLISKTLIGSNISHEEFVWIDNMLKEYDNIKEQIINLKT